VNKSCSSKGKLCSHNRHVIATFSIAALLVGVLIGSLLFSGIETTGYARFMKSSKAKATSIGGDKYGTVSSSTAARTVESCANALSQWKSIAPVLVTCISSNYATCDYATLANSLPAECVDTRVMTVDLTNLAAAKASYQNRIAALTESKSRLPFTNSGYKKRTAIDKEIATIQAQIAADEANAAKKNSCIPRYQELYSKGAGDCSSVNKCFDGIDNEGDGTCDSTGCFVRGSSQNIGGDKYKTAGLTYQWNTVLNADEDCLLTQTQEDIPRMKEVVCKPGQLIGDLDNNGKFEYTDWYAMRDLAIGALPMPQNPQEWCCIKLANPAQENAAFEKPKATDVQKLSNLITGVATSDLRCDKAMSAPENANQFWVVKGNPLNWSIDGIAALVFIDAVNSEQNKCSLSVNGVTAIISMQETKTLNGVSVKVMDVIKSLTGKDKCKIEFFTPQSTAVPLPATQTGVSDIAVSVKFLHKDTNTYYDAPVAGMRLQTQITFKNLGSGPAAEYRANIQLQKVSMVNGAEKWSMIASTPGQSQGTLAAGATSVNIVKVTVGQAGLAVGEDQITFTNEKYCLSVAADPLNLIAESNNDNNGFDQCWNLASVPAPAAPAPAPTPSVSTAPVAATSTACGPSGPFPQGNFRIDKVYLGYSRCTSYNVCTSPESGELMAMPSSDTRTISDPVFINKFTTIMTANYQGPDYQGHIASNYIIAQGVFPTEQNSGEFVLYRGPAVDVGQQIPAERIVKTTYFTPTPSGGLTSIMGVANQISVGISKFDYGVPYCLRARAKIQTGYGDTNPCNNEVTMCFFKA